MITGEFNGHSVSGLIHYCWAYFAVTMGFDLLQAFVIENIQVRSIGQKQPPQIRRLQPPCQMGRIRKYGPRRPPARLRTAYPSAGGSGPGLAPAGPHCMVDRVRRGAGAGDAERGAGQGEADAPGKPGGPRCIFGGGVISVSSLAVSGWWPKTPPTKINRGEAAGREAVLGEGGILPSPLGSLRRGRLYGGGAGGGVGAYWDSWDRFAHPYPPRLALPPSLTPSSTDSRQ